MAGVVPLTSAIGADGLVALDTILRAPQLASPQVALPALVPSTEAAAVLPLSPPAERSQAAIAQAPAAAAAPAPLTAQEEDELLLRQMREEEVRADWAHRREQAERGNLAKQTFAEWYRSLPLCDQQVMNRCLTTAESDEIAAASEGFMSVTKMVTKAAKASNPFASLGLVGDEGEGLTRSQLKKARRDAERKQALAEEEEKSEQRRKERADAKEAKVSSAAAKAKAKEVVPVASGAAGGTLEPKAVDGQKADEEDALERRLAKPHSTATVAPPTAKRAANKKRWRSELEKLTVRQLKAAFKEAGETFDPSWAGRPDEQKLLRERAQSLRSMCKDPVYFADVSSIHADIQAHMEVLEQQQLPDAGGGAGKVLAMDVGKAVVASFGEMAKDAVHAVASRAEQLVADVLPQKLSKLEEARGKVREQAKRVSRMREMKEQAESKRLEEELQEKLRKQQKEQSRSERRLATAPIWIDP